MTQLNRTAITNHAELKYQIMLLNDRKEEQEEKVARAFKEVYYSLHPMSIIRSAINSFSEDSESKQKIVNLGIGAGASFLIAKLFSKTSLKGYITSMIAEKATKYFINNKPDFISSGIDKLKQYFNKNKN
jgi:hypothetical protein